MGVLTNVMRILGGGGYNTCPKNDTKMGGKQLYEADFINGFETKKLTLIGGYYSF